MCIWDMKRTRSKGTTVGTAGTDTAENGSLVIMVNVKLQYRGIEMENLNLKL